MDKNQLLNVLDSLIQNSMKGVDKYQQELDSRDKTIIYCGYNRHQEIIDKLGSFIRIFKLTRTQLESDYITIDEVIKILNVEIPTWKAILPDI